MQQPEYGPSVLFKDTKRGGWGVKGRENGACLKVLAAYFGGSTSYKYAMTVNMLAFVPAVSAASVTVGVPHSLTAFSALFAGARNTIPCLVSTLSSRVRIGLVVAAVAVTRRW